ncbi:MAG: serine/threonine-protein phosphatase [Cyanobacteria bacterium]|nr:serine/threonine-protein phosphatase [Cyanobacteriota bacterium]MDW8200763.1 serine/threonine-protein phosphatase [Cyanobacteriota bacterium SKYGB_h_bin112]
MNLETSRFCQHCGAVIPKRYLWAIGELADQLQPGHVVDDRYVVNASCVLLDTRPGLAPLIPNTVSPIAAAYMRLLPYRLHVPQPYGCVTASLDSGEALLLLEQGAIATVGDQAGTLLPELTHVWSHAHSVRQLSWLRQIACLWNPCQAEQMSYSLITPVVIRADGGWVRLLELVPDVGGIPATLSQLGQCWLEWATFAQPDIQKFLLQLCHWLIEGKITTADHLVTVLDWGLQELMRSQSRYIQICTLSDQGPTRQRNEDACYPPSGSVTNCQELSGLLAIVCDGIGGHEGGDVASNLAITSLYDQLKTLTLEAPTSCPARITTQLKMATIHANDVINQRNNQLKKADRQRMGTTVLIAAVHAHDLYITHVGDSRVYQITRTGCRQLTLDDDFATREVRLGNTFYYEALQHYSSGALVQALGISSSNNLHPTTQRIVLDEDCVILLCSDGLSDNDRVEGYWQTEILPLLIGNADLNTVAHRLIDIANTQNGHDNVTVALLYCHVVLQAPSTTLEPPTPSQLSALASTSVSDQPSRLKTRLVTTTHPRRLLRSRRRPWLTIGILALGVFTAVPFVHHWLAPTSDRPITPTLNSPSPTVSLPPVQLEPASIVQTTRPIQILSNPIQTELVNPAPAVSPTVTTVPPNSIVRIMSKQVPQQANSPPVSWVQLVVCQEPDTVESSSLANYGQGWILESELVNAVMIVPNPTQLDVTRCTP